MEPMELPPEARDRFTAAGVPLLARRSPIGRSEGNLVSRDYQPILGGPKLIASWPIGPAPNADFADRDWEIDRTTYVPIQRNILTAPNLAPVGHAPTYLVICGRGHVDPGETLSVRLSNPHFTGKPYETTTHIQETDPTAFLSTAVECAPDAPDYEDPAARVFPEYRLEARVTAGSGYLDPGTNVQLWSE